MWLLSCYQLDMPASPNDHCRVTIRLHRQSQFEHEPTARPISGSKRAAHLLSMLKGDGQSQPGTGSATGRVANGKTVKQPVEIGRFDPRSPIGNNHDDGPRFLLGRDLYFPAGGVDSCILEEVADDALETSPVNVNRHFVPASQQPGRRQSIGYYRSKELFEIDPLRMRFLCAGLEA
jgi:hypothetical protein